MSSSVSPPSPSPSPPPGQNQQQAKPEGVKKTDVSYRKLLPILDASFEQFFDCRPFQNGIFAKFLKYKFPSCKMSFKKYQIPENLDILFHHEDFYASDIRKKILSDASPHMFYFEDSSTMKYWILPTFIYAEQQGVMMLFLFEENYSSSISTTITAKVTNTAVIDENTFSIEYLVNHGDAKKFSKTQSIFLDTLQKLKTDATHRPTPLKYLLSAYSSPGSRRPGQAWNEIVQQLGFEEPDLKGDTFFYISSFDDKDTSSFKYYSSLRSASKTNPVFSKVVFSDIKITAKDYFNEDIAQKQIVRGFFEKFWRKKQSVLTTSSPPPEVAKNGQEGQNRLRELGDFILDLYQVSVWENAVAETAFLGEKSSSGSVGLFQRFNLFKKNDPNGTTVSSKFDKVTKKMKREYEILASTQGTMLSKFHGNARFFLRMIAAFCGRPVRVMKEFNRNFGLEFITSEERSGTRSSNATLVDITKYHFLDFVPDPSESLNTISRRSLNELSYRIGSHLLLNNVMNPAVSPQTFSIPEIKDIYEKAETYQKIDYLHVSIVDTLYYENIKLANGYFLSLLPDDLAPEELNSLLHEIFIVSVLGLHTLSSSSSSEPPPYLTHMSGHYQRLFSEKESWVTRAKTNVRKEEKALLCSFIVDGGFLNYDGSYFKGLNDAKYRKTAMWTSFKCDEKIKKPMFGILFGNSLLTDDVLNPFKRAASSDLSAAASKAVSDTADAKSTFFSLSSKGTQFKKFSENILSTRLTMIPSFNHLNYPAVVESLKYGRNVFSLMVEQNGNPITIYLQLQEIYGSKEYLSKSEPYQVYIQTISLQMNDCVCFLLKYSGNSDAPPRSMLRGYTNIGNTTCFFSMNQDLSGKWSPDGTKSIDKIIEFILRGIFKGRLDSINNDLKDRIKNGGITFCYSSATGKKPSLPSSVKPFNVAMVPVIMAFSSPIGSASVLSSEADMMKLNEIVTKIGQPALEKSAPVKFQRSEVDDRVIFTTENPVVTSYNIPNKSQKLRLEGVIFFKNLDKELVQIDRVYYFNVAPPSPSSRSGGSHTSGVSKRYQRRISRKLKLKGKSHSITNRRR